MVIFFGTVAILVIGTFLGVMIVLLLVPGRKGFVRRERVVAWGPGVSVERARELFAGRLAEEGFVLEPGPDPSRVVAKRPARPRVEGDAEIVTHATKPVSVDATFEPSGSGTLIRMSAKMLDFVLLDSGEGRHLELVLGRLASSDPDSEADALVPSPSMDGIVGVCLGGLTLAAAALPFVWKRAGDYLSGGGWCLAAFGAGIACAAWVAWGSGQTALKNIRLRPAEVSGGGIARIALALAVLGIAAGAGLLLLAISRHLGR